jgi:hypothetical protein
VLKVLPEDKVPKDQVLLAPQELKVLKVESD